MEQNRRIPTTTAIALAQATHVLVPANPQVQAIATQFRLSPKRLIEQVRKSLPAPIEQQLYLQLALDFRIRPHSLKVLLREFLGDRELAESDFEDVPVGQNLVYSRAAELAEYLKGALHLVDKSSLEFADLGISMHTAASLVKTYGPEGAEQLIDSIAAHIAVIGRRLRISHRSLDRQLSIIISFWAKKVLPYCEQNGIPPYVDVIEFFERHKEVLQLAREKEDDDG